MLIFTVDRIEQVMEQSAFLQENMLVVFIFKRTEENRKSAERIQNGKTQLFNSWGIVK